MKSLMWHDRSLQCLRSSETAAQSVRKLIISFTLLLVGTRLRNQMHSTRLVTVLFVLDADNLLLPNWSTVATNWTGVRITVTNYNRSPSV